MPWWSIGPSESAMKRVGRPRHARRILESRWPDGWMPRKFLLVYALISLKHGGFFKSKVMSMIACLPLSWRSVMTYG